MSRARKEFMADCRDSMIDSDSLTIGVVGVVEEGIRESSIVFVGTGDGVGALSARNVAGYGCGGCPDGNRRMIDRKW